MPAAREPEPQPKKSLQAAAWLHGELGELFVCNDRGNPQSRDETFREYLGCGLPEDDYPDTSGEDGCPNCQHALYCPTKGHGRRHVGKPGFGYRTDRCLRDWAATVFVHEVQRAYAWRESGGGGFPIYVGRDPPAVLMEGIDWYSNELAALFAKQTEERRRQLESAGNSPRDP